MASWKQRRKKAARRQYHNDRRRDENAARRERWLHGDPTPSAEQRRNDALMETLGGMSVKQLRAECKRHGIKGYSYLNKVGLINILRLVVHEEAKS